MDKRPIGIFDSGLGGLTVLKEIVKSFPNEDIVYLGDTARVPYGNRSEETIIKFSSEDAAFLLSKGVKCIVVACNTSSSYAIEALTSEIKLPIFDVVSSGAALAVELSKKDNIGVIGTRGTIGSGSYGRSIKKLKPEAVVIEVATPLFVPIIEEGEFDMIEPLMDKYLDVFKSSNVDTLIMGCTHYPIIENYLKKYFGESVTLINPGKGLAKKISETTIDFSTQNSPGMVKYYVTDLNNNFVRIAEMFLENKISDSVQKVEIG